MSDIVLLDTSVYLNVLDIAGLNQDRVSVLEEFASRVQNGDYFLLPMAAIWETGNHIARLPNGERRRQFAQTLVDDVSRAINGHAPYRPTHFPDRDEFMRWLGEFPDNAQKNKSVNKPNEGASLADLSIIKEWERTCALHSMTRVLIWSLDSDLGSYDRII